MIAGWRGEGTGTLEPIKTSAKRVALWQYIFFTILCTVCFLPGNASARILEQTGRTNVSLSTKAGLHVIVGRDVKYLYLWGGGGGEQKGYCNPWTPYNKALMSSLLTINVPVVYMARYVLVLRRAKSITRGIWKGLALEIDTFLDPDMGCPFIGTIAFMFPS
jgi:hypothetical protein